MTAHCQRVYVRIDYFWGLPLTVEKIVARSDERFLAEDRADLQPSGLDIHNMVTRVAAVSASLLNGVKQHGVFPPFSQNNDLLRTLGYLME